LVTDLCEGIRAAVAESLAEQTKLWRETIDEAQSQWHQTQQTSGNQIVEALQQTFKPALNEHALSLQESARVAGDRLQRQLTQWQDTMACDADALAAHHDILVEQCRMLSEQGKQFTHVHEQTQAVVAVQYALDANLKRLQETNAAVDRSVSAAAGDGMADAMRILARAVDMLSAQLVSLPDAKSSRPRRAA
jgi:hypothetical protein